MPFLYKEVENILSVKSVFMIIPCITTLFSSKYEWNATLLHEVMALYLIVQMISNGTD